MDRTLQRDTMLFIEYEEILLGKRKSFSQVFFHYSNEQNEKNAIRVIRYAYEEFLCCDKYHMDNYLTKEVVRLMKLRALMKYIQCPPEIKIMSNLWYLKWKVYPETSRFTERQITIHTYQKLLDGEIKKFPKDYFVGSSGMVRVIICLHYLISNYLQFHSIKEAYEVFSSYQIRQILREYKLLNPCSDNFPLPIDALHTLLPVSQKDELYYHRCRFYQCYKRELRRSRDEEEIE